MPTLRELRFLADNKYLTPLKQLIESHFEPENWDELGEVTDCASYVQNHSRLKRSLFFRDPNYPDCIIAALAYMAAHHPDNLQKIQDYVSLLFGDNTVEVDVSSHSEQRTKVVFRPAVFNVPTESVQNDLVSVMMPFAPQFNDVYSAIKSAASSNGLQSRRVDDIWEDSTIIQDVFSLIYRSHIVVCDFSGKNPNVMYKAGIAHTLGKHVIPITQSKENVPFDLIHHRHLSYLNNRQGVQDLETRLKSRLLSLKSGSM